jgi:PBSX family phage terminase large subunit
VSNAELTPLSPHREFKLTNKQSEALGLCVGNARNIMLYGGSRSGKTFFACWAIVMRAVNEPNSRHCILREKFNAAKRSLWLDTFPKLFSIAFPDLPIKAHGTDYYWRLPNGSEIWVGGLDSKERTEKILGNEYSTLYFNECSQLDYTSIQMARTRLAQKNGLIKKTYYDQNPPVKTHWSYWLFEKKLNPIDEEPLENPQDYASILMNPADNIDNIDEEYLKLLQSMPEAERNRFLLGLYSDASDGQVYYAFDREQHVDENVKRVHGQLMIGMDFNVDPMTCIVAQVVNGEYHVIDELYLNNADTFRMVSELKKKGYHGTVIPDSTGKNRKTSGKSDHLILKEAGFTIPPVRNPFVTDRVNNVNRLFTANKIRISPKCKKLINDLEKVAWKDNKLDQKGANAHLTHISDALGYFLWWIDAIKVPTSTRGIVFE